MNVDVPLILTFAALFCGAIWLIDALFFARARNARNALLAEGDLPEKESWLTEQAKAFSPVLIIVLVVRSFWFEPFVIPSGSMLPTLLIGDFIVVNKFAYGLRLPVVNQKVISVGDPKRGDVVIFRRPKRVGQFDRPLSPKERESEDAVIGATFIKRCIGLPGDTVSYNNHEFRINGELISDTMIGNYAGEASSSMESVTLLRSENLQGVVHQSLQAEYSSLNGEWVVPAGHYFMMGDNRDGSSDSRDWGFVPQENLMGRASFVWFHFDWKRKGVVAWNRIGTKIK
jgi:signal peptidase I